MPPGVLLPSTPTLSALQLRSTRKDESRDGTTRTLSRIDVDLGQHSHGTSVREKLSVCHARTCGTIGDSFAAERPLSLCGSECRSRLNDRILHPAMMPVSIIQHPWFISRALHQFSCTKSTRTRRTAITEKGDLS